MVAVRPLTGKHVSYRAASKASYSADPTKKDLPYKKGIIHVNAATHLLLLNINTTKKKH